MKTYDEEEQQIIQQMQDEIYKNFRNQDLNKPRDYSWLKFNFRMKRICFHMK